MSDKLYRIVPYDYDSIDPHVIVGRREMLVEVVPDYEAAESELVRGLESAGVLWYKLVRRIVDAALKGTDEPKVEVQVYDMRRNPDGLTDLEQPYDCPHTEADGAMCGYPVGLKGVCKMGHYSS